MKMSRAIVVGKAAINMYLKEHDSEEYREAHEKLQELFEQEANKEFKAEREAENVKA